MASEDVEQMVTSEPDYCSGWEDNQAKGTVPPRPRAGTYDVTGSVAGTAHGWFSRSPVSVRDVPAGTDSENRTALGDAYYPIPLDTPVTRARARCSWPLGARDDLTDGEAGSRTRASLRSSGRRGHPPQDWQAVTPTLPWGRSGHIVNPEWVNRLSRPVAYALYSQGQPTLLTDATSSIAQRAAFATRHLWVTSTTRPNGIRPVSW